jgi:outer membrane protein assembly factor BamB
MRPVRSVLAWLPAVLVVPAAMAASVQLTGSDDDTNPLLELQSFDLGTTWVYEVRDHDRPAGTHTKQVTSKAGVDFDRLDGVAVTNRYTDYPGRGAYTNVAYLSADDDTMYQEGQRQDGDLLKLEPAAPTYELPLDEGESWSYQGTFGTAKMSFDSTIEDIGPVEVGGRRFTDCLHVVTEFRFTFESGPGDPETVEEWTCPTFGTVRSVDTIPAQDVELTEELVAFHGVDEDWTAEDARTPAGSVTADPEPGDTVGFDAARTRSVPGGSLQPSLAWADLRSADIAYPPVSDGDAMVLVEEDGLVTGMDVASGQMRWRQQVTRPPVAPVALASGLALVADGRKDLWALGTDDGSARWVHAFDDVVSTSPVVVGNEVVVVTDDGVVTALDLADGHAVWERDLGVRVRSAPALAGDVVLVADISGTVTALDTETGGTRWSHALEGALTAGPAGSDGLALVADDVNVVYALDTSDGSVRWQTRTNRDTAGDFALTDDAALLVDGGQYLESFDLADGRRSWSRRIDTTAQSPVVVGDEVLTVSDDGRVALRDLEDGRETRSWPLPRPHAGSAPSVDVPLGLVDGDVVVGAALSGDGVTTGLFAYPTAAPEPGAVGGTSFAVDTRLVPSPPSAPPSLVGDTLLVPSGDGTLYRSTGRSDFDEVVTSKALLPSVSTDGDLVVVHVGDEVRGYPLAGGDQRWRFPAAEPFFSSVPTIAGDRVFVPERGLGLAAVSTDGAPLWFTPLDNALGTGSPLPLPGGDVFWGAGGAARFDGGTGDQVWAVPDTQTYADAAYDDGAVFAEVVRNTHTSGLAAIDAETGRIRWLHESASTAIFVGPAAADGVVVHGDSVGLVVALDERTGEELWHLQLSTPLAGPPAIVDGRVYLTEQGRTEDLFQRDYRLSAHDLRTGRFLGAYQPPSSTLSGSPSVTASPDGRLVLPVGGSVENGNGLSPLLVLEPRDE